MANAQRGAVAFDADGKSWTLKFSTNAICEIEDALGGEPLQIVAETMNNPKTARIKTLRAVFWGGLRDHHPEVTMAQAGALMDEIGIAAAGARIGEAFQLAFPEAKGKANPPKATGGQTGRR